MKFTRIIIIFLLTSCFAGVTTDIHAQREKVRLLNNWEYVKGDLGGVYEALRTGKAAMLPEWKPVNMPHCFNQYDAVDPDKPYYQGPGWYRTWIKPVELTGQNRILLLFEGAGQKTRVYVNDQLVGSHVGGYDEFTIDITNGIRQYRRLSSVSIADSIPLVIRCDNSRDLEMIPSDLSDFNIYGGLYRYVDMITVPAVSFSRIHINTSLDGNNEKARITLAPELYNPVSETGAAKIKYILKDPSGNVVQQFTGDLNVNDPESTTHTFLIDQPQLWSVDKPELYTLEANLTTPHGTDRLIQHFGIRDFEFIPHGPFMLNGQRLFLRGTHRHEDHAGYAAAMPENLIIKEMQMMKEMGVNFIRLAHYQQSRIVLDACDSLGILVWEEIPWCRGGLGNEIYQAQAKRMLTNLINQHYNHPSVIIWGLGNENDWPGDFPVYDSAKIRSFMTELNELAHQLDPVRKTAIRRCDFCSDIVDVYSPSIWAGWYRGKYTEYTKISKEWNDKVNVFLHAEWGASSHARRHSEDPDKGLESVLTGNGADERTGDFLLKGGKARVSKDGDWSETYACNLIDWHLKEQEKMDWHTGAAYWPFKDFSTPLRPENPVPYMNQKGVVERDFTKKESYYVFQSYWTDKPMAHIYGHTWPVRWGEKDEQKMVKVYSNCDRAELFLNGKSLGTKTRNSQNFPAAGLRWMVKFNEGENHLKIIAHKGNEQVTDSITQVYQTEKWGDPSLLKISQLSRRKDTVLVEVRTFDAQNIFCPDAKNKIRFSVAGGGKLLDDLGTSTGSGVIQLYNGRAMIKLILTGDKAVVAAASPGLKTGCTEIYY